jgi:ABC-type spermidine/putrescine transport system permease subunit II
VGPPFDRPIISLFPMGAQTAPVRVCNSRRLEIAPTIAAMSALLIAVTALTLMTDGLLRGRHVAMMDVRRQEPEVKEP